MKILPQESRDHGVLVGRCWRSGADSGGYLSAETNENAHRGHPEVPEKVS